MTPDQSEPIAPHAPRYALFWAMVVCALAALTLAHPALMGGFLVNPRSDQYIAGFAFRDYAAESLRSGNGFPLWNPYLFGGMPYVDAMHGDIFYPTFILRMILPTDVAMTWGMILHVWLAGVAGYAFFRAHKLSFHASLIGGLAYMMSGMIAGLVSPGHDGKIFVSALLPVQLLVLRAGIHDGRRWAWGALSLVVGLGLLTPHPQLLQYMLLAGGAYSLWMVFFEKGAASPPRNVGLKRLGLSLGAIAIGFAIGAIQFLPLRQYTPWSPRSGGHDWATAVSFSMPPEEIVSTILPQFSGILDNYWGRNGIHFHSEYLGLPVLLLAAAAFGGADKHRRRTVWFFAGLFVVTMLWAFGGFTPFYRLVAAVIPGTMYFRAPSTIMFLSAFAVAALAALGSSRVLASDVGKRFLPGALIAVAVLTLMGVAGGFTSMLAQFVPESRVDMFNANKPAVTLGAWRMFVFAAGMVALIYAASTKRLSASVAGGLLAILMVADLWSVDRLYWQFSPRAAQLYGTDAAIDRIKADSQPGRVLAIGMGGQSVRRDPFLGGDALMSNGVRTVLGYHGNELGRYAKLYGRDDGFRGVGNPNFWEIANLKWIYTDVPQLPAGLDGFEKVLGPVKNAVGSDIYLYRTTADTRFAWVTPVILQASDDQLYPALASARFPVKSGAVFEPGAKVDAQQITAAPPPLGINARVTRYAPGSIDIELDSAAPAKSALVVAENFYPGWTATVDGKPATLARADYVIMGVPLEAGARKIELRFADRAYSTGKLITLVAILASIVAVIGGVVLERRVAHA